MKHFLVDSLKCKAKGRIKNRKILGYQFFETAYTLSLLLPLSPPAFLSPSPYLTPLMHLKIESVY